MKLIHILLTLIAFYGSSIHIYAKQTNDTEAQIDGELRQWHKITLSFTGPETSEQSTPNPFTDYRLDVTFTHTASGTSYLVPGYYAADGDSANSQATNGNIWRVHFAPDRTGAWHYEVSFKQGAKVAISNSIDDGETVAFHGITGNFEVEKSDKTGRDNRAKGRLQYVGEHYLRFSGNGEYFLKQGADAPENLLAYQDFDGDFKNDGHRDNHIKDWSAHIKDWRQGDPTWRDQKGKGIIGAINYLASEGLNAVSFLTFNIEGDDRNVFPYTGYDERFRMDCSRLDQWEIVFEHANRQGMYLHFKTQESENETLLDNGAVGPQRSFYYRELVARFGHHLALNWNLGEENGDWGKKDLFQTTPQRQAMAEWFTQNDPYQHHRVIHNGQSGDDLLGDQSTLTGFSLQTYQADFSRTPSNVAKYVRKSAESGRPWVVACDEPGDASYSIRPDNDPAMSHENGRKNALWGCIMNGGAGSEYYFGYKLPHSDLSCTDYRSRDKWWDYCRYALEFFKDNKVPFWKMKPMHDLSISKDSWCLAEPKNVYLIYLKSAQSAQIDLSKATGDYTVMWFNPRSGGSLQTGSITEVVGGEIADLGEAPKEAKQDWTVLVSRKTAKSNN